MPIASGMVGFARMQILLVTVLQTALEPSNTLFGNRHHPLDLGLGTMQLYSRYVLVSAIKEPYQLYRLTRDI